MLMPIALLSHFVFASLQLEMVKQYSGGDFGAALGAGSSLGYIGQDSLPNVYVRVCACPMCACPVCMCMCEHYTDMNDMCRW